MAQDLVDDQTEEVGSQLDGDRRLNQAVNDVPYEPSGPPARSSTRST